MENKIKEFKAFDKIIWRAKDFGDDNDRTWRCALYSHSKENYIFTTESLMLNKNNIDILPYEGNEHLVGTTDDPNEEVKLEKGELIITFDSINDFSFGCFGAIREFSGYELDKFKSNGVYWCLAIKFSDFNPNDMEETKKHILCVKNGKIIKYKG